MNIQHRIFEEAHYIISNNATIRETAKAFKVSKTLIHLDVTERLKKINIKLYT